MRTPFSRRLVRPCASTGHLDEWRRQGYTSYSKVKEFHVTLDEDSTSRTARISNPSDKGADLDLFVFKGAALIGYAADGGSEEAVTVNNPTGTYTIVVNGYAVPAGTTKYDYLDILANKKFGTIAVTDADATHVPGATWEAPGVVTAKAAPAAGRILLGNVSVKTDSNITIGTGEVRVRNVAQ